MKITESLISIPPYISTSWDNITSLTMEHDTLVFTLKDLNHVAVPNLSTQEVEQIFSAHASFLEAHLPQPQKLQFNQLDQFMASSSPLRINVGPLEGVGQMLEHNPSQSGLPSIPEDSLERIRSLSKIIPEEEILAMPAPEANCNCMYCQVARILRQEIHEKKEHEVDVSEPEEKISEEDLRFDEWKVELISEKLYKVSRKLDSAEEYRVTLGDPIGCTCGKTNCEHIVAVLRS